MKFKKEYKNPLLGCLTEHELDGDIGVIIKCYEDQCGLIVYDVYYHRDGLLKGLLERSITNIISD